MGCHLRAARALNCLVASPGFGQVHINAVACTFFVKKRPFVDEFIEIVTSWFDVVVFTAR